MEVSSSQHCSLLGRTQQKVLLSVLQSYFGQWNPHRAATLRLWSTLPVTWSCLCQLWEPDGNLAEPAELLYDSICIWRAASHLERYSNTLTLCSSGSHKTGDCANLTSLLYSKIQTDSTPICLSYTAHHHINLRVLFLLVVFLYSHPLKNKDFLSLQSLSITQSSQSEYYTFSFFKTTGYVLWQSIQP